MNLRKLSEVAPASVSRVKPAPDEMVWHLTLDQIESGSSRINHRIYGPASEAASSSFTFDNGNVLYSKLRPYLNKVVCPDTYGIATTELVPLRPNPRELNREYLCFFLRSPEFVSWASAQVDGAKMPRIKMKAFWAYEIPIPPVDDQVRIAHLLGKVEWLIAQSKQQMQQLDELLKSAFLEMFGDPIKNPRRFAIRRLSEFYVNPKDGTKCGPFGSALKKSELVDSGVPVWSMDNIGPDGQMVLPFRIWITKDKYKELAAYSVQDGDIVISRAGTVGKMCVARMHERTAIISTNLIRLRLSSDLRPLHFVSLMLYCKGRVGRLKVGADGAFTHMNTGILDSLEFPYPPIELQDRFGVIASQVAAIKSRYQQSLTDLESLYGALSQRAFRGELNLSRLPMPDAESQKPQTAIRVDSRSPTDSQNPIDLPDTDLLPFVLDDRTRLQELLRFWLEDYCARLKGARFSAQAFLAAAQTHIAELHPDSDFELGTEGYEQVKVWVFEALASGRLTQGYADGDNRVTLSAAPARG